MILIFLAAVLAVPLYFLNADWAGWLTLYATFAVVPLSLSYRRHRGLIAAIWSTLAVHHMIAIANSYYITILGADADALSFHRQASARSIIGGHEFGLGARFYSTMLSFAYSAGGPSAFFGAETSILAYALSCVVLVKMLDLLKVQRHRLACVLIFGLHPAIAIFTSITLRESWQILFFMLSVYGLLSFRLHARPIALLWGVLSALLMGALHNGLIVYALFLVPFALFFRMGIRSSLSLRRLVGMCLTGAVAAGLAAAALTGSLPYAPTLQHVAQGDALDYAASYRENAEKGARAEYGITLDSSSPAAFVKSLPLVYGYYMLSPFPWQIRSPLDAFAALEAWFRIALLICALYAWWTLPRGTDSGIRRFLLILYFSMSILWAMGTINYGTAIRHHIVPLWILILLGAPPLLDRMRRKKSRSARSAS